MMKNKRIICLLLALCMIFSLCACGAEEVISAVQTGVEIAEAISEASGDASSAEESQITLPTQVPEKTAEPAVTTIAPSAPEETEAPAETAPAEEAAVPDEGGYYYSKDDVALYIHIYGHLPSNFITKKEAEALGWSGGSIEKYAPGKCIGGSRFGNYEGNLPTAKGRTYTECDIDTLGASSRGAKRIVFSNDGLIYYTGDHYETFELLYGEE